MTKLKDNQIDADKIELEKYIDGEWNEIASFPAWFEKNCTNTKAKYTNKGDFIEVNNTCDKRKCDDNVCKIEKSQKIGKAFPTKDKNRLKVQFFPPFKADYTIEFVDTDYQHAIVGSGKGYLWFLSRNKDISEDTFNEMKAIAKEKGYDISKLRRQ